MVMKLVNSKLITNNVSSNQLIMPKYSRTMP